MPSVDGPHGFLTALLPLHLDPCLHPDHGSLTSPAHAVRELLASLPTAQHSAACATSGRQSPFARSSSTHFARFAVIDAPAYNGRDPRDAILTAAHLASDPLSAEPTDVLDRSFLLFCADFDTPADGPDPVAAYLKDLWTRMPAEWSAILAHCEGYRPGGGAEDFAAYVASAQVETTMPFNDYARPGEAGAAAPIRGPLILAGVAGLAVLGLVMLAIPAPLLARALLGILFGAVAAGAVAFWAISRKGPRPSPWASETDLPTVLKALHLQGSFTRFAIANQGAVPEALHAAFKAFVAQERPGDLTQPTQAPGVIPHATRAA